MSEIKDVTKHDGGDYVVFNQQGATVENFPDVETAIENIVALWHESDSPEAFTIRHHFGLHFDTVCTVCPIGSDSCYVVRNNGDVQRWTEIQYVTVDGKIEYTFARLNGIEYKFKF